MATDMGRGIMAPDPQDNISTNGVTEMRTLAATTAEVIGPIADDYVAGDGVRKIITSPNPYIITQPGELLLVTSTPKYFTYFHDTPVGEAPDDMTDMWGTNYTRQVVAEETTLGGKALRLAASSAEYRLLALPTPDNLGDPSACEMVVRWRASEESAIPRLMLWGAGEPGSENGIHSMYTGGQLRSGRFMNGYPGTHPGTGWSFTPGMWYLTRVRIMFYESLGRFEFRHRMTPAHWPEYTTWGHRTSEDLNNLVQAGAAGIYFRGPGESMIDWISVSWDKGMAAKPEVE